MATNDKDAAVAAHTSLPPQQQFLQGQYGGEPISMPVVAPRKDIADPSKAKVVNLETGDKVGENMKGNAKQTKRGPIRRMTTWAESLEDLIAYKKKYGNVNVAQGGSHSRLGNWVKSQRKQYKTYKKGKKTFMNEERINALEAIGFVWALTFTWDAMYEKLIAYKKKYGNIYVTQGGSHSRLGNWVNSQRTHYQKFKKGKKTVMNEERINALEAIGFVWTLTFTWDAMYEKLRFHKSRYGTIEIPTRYKDGEYNRLGKWLYIQKHRYGLMQKGVKTLLKPEQVCLLEELGVNWMIEPAKYKGKRNTYDCRESMVPTKQDFAATKLASVETETEVNVNTNVSIVDSGTGKAMTTDYVVPCAGHGVIEPGFQEIAMETYMHRKRKRN